MIHPASEVELQAQAADVLRNAGIPLQPQCFPSKYHHEALLMACPSIPTPKQQRYDFIQRALDARYQPGSFESFQAQLAGALINLMFLYPAICLRALHHPQIKQVFELASAFDWENHVQGLSAEIRKAQSRREDEEAAA